ncbi:MAG: S-layer homology domain-containing protein, partial [Ruminococcaceae bacterium]|nr:S-layer homology domain-containing protein [Oscillospiraceae bacterium]
GNFNPDAEIKRSEFAAVVCRALGQESAATSTVSKFPDVASNHWAVGYIGWAAGKEIVNGYEDGTFKPDNAVTYQEAVKMIMCALGFGPIAESDSYGGYPYGYLSLASTYGVTDGLSANPTAAAPRSLVAMLVENALDAPLVGKGYTAYGESYIIYDGKKAADYEVRTILSQYLDVIKVKAEVVANYKSKPALLDKDGRQSVELKLNKAYNSTDKETYADYICDTEGDLLADLEVFVGETDANDYLASVVDAYLFINADEEVELKAIIGNTKSTRTLKVEKDIETAEATAEEVTFEYWEDIENDTDAEEVEISADALVYVNGEEIGKISASSAARDAFNAIVDAEGYVEFVGPKTGEFTNVFITKYEYAMVEEVDLEEKMISLTDGNGWIELDKENFVYNIYKDDEAIELEDVKEDDVLTIIWPGGNEDGAKYVDIYVSDATVSGKVTGVKSGVYYIDRVEYTPVSGTTLKVGDEGIFFLTADGRVYSSKATSTLSDNYAFILKAYANDDAEVYSLRLFKKDGSVATYNLAESVKVTRIADDEIDTETLKTADAQSLLIDEIKGWIETTDEETAIANVANRLITFSLSGDEISKISLAVEDGEEGESYNYVALDGNYKESSSKLAASSSNYIYLEEATSLFYAPVTEIETGKFGVVVDDVALVSLASLDEDTTYTSYVYAKDGRDVGAALFYNEFEPATRDSALAIVTSIATGLNADGEEATEITVFQSGDKATYVYNDDVDDLAEGDIIQFVADEAGEISRYAEIYDYETRDLKDTNDANDISFVAGYVTGFAKGDITISDVAEEDTGDDYSFNIESGCTLAAADVNKMGTNSFVKALSSTSSFKYTKNFDSDSAVYYIVVARLVDGEIVDAIQFCDVVVEA